jgi:uncharacterized coiled-coil DUF342 family protein
LEQASEKGDAQREALERELDEIQSKIREVETALMEIVPEWENRAKAEKDERARYVMFV